MPSHLSDLGVDMTPVDFGTVNVSFDGEDVLDANPRSNVSGTQHQEALLARVALAERLSWPVAGG